ncbi:glycoside hydrolase family 97 protein [Paraflavitalea pollutisoli]|uniref:glycoside hydrolase family 97 protein n=1 Tax=Paraflavitalea pollutisoli TaxID=3034143 RepID=UPI0023EB3FDB|nr:glycoside hydrolase family 97 protein [Paraflavitalea sp. H1-2-19X]
MRVVLVFIALLCVVNSYGQLRVASPDKQTVAEIDPRHDGQLVYRVLFRGATVVDWSALGLQTQAGVIGRQVTVIKSHMLKVRSQFNWPLGERAVVNNHYQQLIMECDDSGIGFRLVFRVFDGNVAFRYEVLTPPGSEWRIGKEETTFQLPSAFTLYQYNHESVFTPTAIDTLVRSSDLPTTIVSGKHYLSIGEANNEDYTKAELKKAGKHTLGIAFTKDSVVRYNTTFRTPWRTISVANSAIGLQASSDLYLKLSEPVVSNNMDWIKPGKLIRAQLTTQAGLECIDFAATNNFQYIMYDAGWYGAEFRGSSDPTQPIDAIDMQRVIDYGKQKGIGVILYVNYVGLKAQLDSILPLYKKWGVAGLKFGFVDGVSQQGIQWLAQAMKKTQDHGFVLNIHDNYKPTGLSRIYPALLTQEGIRGDENSPDAFHNTVLPFSRFLAGPADFTFCFPNPTNSFSKNIKVSKAQQLALTVVYFSPLQSIFWYGKPLDYTNTDEIEFFKYVPTVWDESHYLAGEIGQYVAVARRSGDTWFMGNVAGPADWAGEIRCDFLGKGKTYTATIYEDDAQSGIRKRTLTVRRGDKLPVAIKAKGGQAIIFR